MNDELTANEREMMRKLVAWRTISLGILARWNWLFIVVFLAVFAGSFRFLMQRTAHSQWRYTAKTRLLYMPTNIGNGKSIGERQLFNILNRVSLKKRVGDAIPLPADEKEMLGATLEIKQESRPNNIYTLTANSAYPEAAVRKVNAYAEVLMAEYEDFRVRELERWFASSDSREREIRGQIAAIEAEETLLKTKVGTFNPVEVLTTLSLRLSDQRRELMLLDVECAGEKARLERHRQQLGDKSSAILASASSLRKLATAMDKLDGEIAELRENYTDLNPKVRGKLDDRAALEAEYREILETNGIHSFDADEIEGIERAANALVEAETRIEAIEAGRPPLERAIRDGEERLDELIGVVPQLERLAARRGDLEMELHNLSTSSGEASFLRETVRNDLLQIEPATGASGRMPLSVQNFLLAAGGAAACTVALMAWTVLCGLWLGRVRGAVEIGAYGDVTVLGSLPGRWGMRQKEEKDVMEVISINFGHADVPKGVVLVCRLRGAKPQPKFVASLDWSLSMSGLRPFILRVLSADGFEPPEGTESLFATFRKGSEGWFPVVNRYSLAPTELEMLKADLATLRESFDCIFILMDEGIRHGGNFLRQLLEVSESALVLVGADRTRRRDLAYARRLIFAAGKPILGLVTGERGRVVRHELEASKWW
jgi:uncharacterized protein involved in exopolysaccharide biosynthesis